MDSNQRELEEAQRILKEGPSDEWEENTSRALRYIEKALEHVRCMYCHGSLDKDREYYRHYKGFVHAECAERYRGRIDYEQQHGIY